MDDIVTIWPMGAELPVPDKLEKLWDHPLYVAETKIDGERIVLVFTRDGIKAFTRSSSKDHPERPIEVTHRWPQLQNLDTRMIPVGTIIDGEAFSLTRRAEEVAGLFNYKSDAPMPDDVEYIVFDCVRFGETSLENDPWILRRLFAERIARELGLSTTVVNYTDKKKFFEDIIASGGEGVVLKFIYGPYVQGKKPANLWVKAKRKDTFDCVIVGFKPAKPGKYSGLVGSVELAQYSGGELVTVCNASGMDDPLRISMTKSQGEYLGKVAVVDAYERIPGSLKLRHPRIKYVRPEGSKDPRDCVVEGGPSGRA